ncbi:MAG: excinuclease ABC subunit UvrA [Polyangiaceae bacterium]|nr:excinuclease ABC subunit UvrA [Polyangiaceae bacterium]
MARDAILIRGARQHNLNVPELVIPKHRLVVFTGVSGSGKSSLAFDTLYAEGQRRYVESLSSYARQFLGQMEKPAYDHIRGLSPTIAIEQKAASANPRSTVGTITEVHDYLRVLYARIGVQHCPQCGEVVAALSTDEVVQRVAALRGPHLVLAPLVAHRRGEFRELLADLASRGFVRVRVDGVVARLEALGPLDRRRKHTIDLVVDRLDPTAVERGRLHDSLETALREGQGQVVVERAEGDGGIRLSQSRTCTRCGLGLPSLSPQSFSFNNPVGMCPECNGLGHRTEMDPALLVPDPTRSLFEGAIVPLASTMQRRSGITWGMVDAVRREFKIDFKRPWHLLPDEHQKLMLYGTGSRRFRVSWQGSHGDVTWPMAYEGIVPTMTRRFRETKSEDMRRYYMQFLTDALCRDCDGTRLRAESRAVTVAGKSLVAVLAMSVAEASQHFSSVRLEGSEARVAQEILKEVRGRLGFLGSVGLDYLGLDRAGASLSGGEAQRIRLASQLGSELSGVLYVLDEPSIGLHQRDNRRLIDTLCQLRDGDNSVIVVEHDAETIESADWVVDFGPGAGRQGGRVVFSGTPAKLRRADTLTGRYLARKVAIPTPRTRRGPRGWLRVIGAREHNLRNIDVAIPLGTFTTVAGVSGAGKSSLVAGILYPALARKLHCAEIRVGAHDRIDGIEALDKVIHIDQAPIGRTPRSNPATYTKAFDLVREIFAATPNARAAGFAAGRFSFNVPGGRCEACHGDGMKRVEMHFLADVFVPCEVCHGRRYNEATLAVRYRALDIAQVLDLTVAEALKLFAPYPKLARILRTLADVGLDYVHLGQPAPTLSGGEAQRVKLSRELARTDTGRTLYVLDEPTTGLHFDDVKKLLGVLDRLVAAGNTVVVIEHHLDVIRCSDHVIDLGPEGGAGGGEIIAMGTPEEVARAERSYTGRYLAKALGQGAGGRVRAKPARRG